MKRNTVKAFTLVEMLIVIVIIGILIASLMPRMQTAQGRARDVARKNDLSQIQTAIITSQSDRGSWPGMKWNKEASQADAYANGGIPVKDIKTQLLNAWMSEVPSDPNASNDNFWLGTTATAGNNWQYLYMVWTRNWVSNAWFVLMAKTEVEWSSNRVVCNDWNEKGKITWWVITSTDDLATVNICSKVSKYSWAANTKWCSVADKTNCIYDETWELRYILLY